MWSEGSDFPPELARRPIGHGLESTVSTTRGRLSPEISGASARIVAHRLTPRIATVSPKPSTGPAPEALFCASINSANAALQKVQHRPECAVPDEVFVTGLWGDPKLLRFRCRIEQPAAKPQRYYPIALAMENEDRGLNLANPRQRVEAVAHQCRGWDKGIVILGDFSDAGERRFENQPGNRSLRRQGHGNPRSERFPVQHEPVRRDALVSEEVKRRNAVGEQAGFGRCPRVTAIASIFDHQHPIPGVGK